MKRGLFHGKVLECFFEEGFLHILLNDGDRSVNTLHSQALKELDEVVKNLNIWEESPEGLIISSAKDTFIAGADIKEFQELFKIPEEALEKQLKIVHNIFEILENLKYPTVSLLNGICLGGGLELALSTSYRLATPETILGFPETQLGIIPGWGGTLRFPRLVGPDTAIEWIASGKRFSAQEALKAGAIDGIVSKEQLMDSGKKFIKNFPESSWKKRREEKSSPKFLNPDEKLMVFESAKKIYLQNQPAMDFIDSLEKSLTLSSSQGKEYEIKTFVKLTKSPLSASLIHVFLTQQHVKKKGKKIASIANMDEKFKNVAVVGSGIMGTGIAYQALLKGFFVTLKDTQLNALQKATHSIHSLLEKEVQRGKIHLKKSFEILSRFQTTTSMENSSFDLLIEAVTEKESTKVEVLQKAENKDFETLLATNTSTISVKRLGHKLAYPSRFCGIHFFNPVPKMPLVEIIRGPETSTETLAKATAFALALGKMPIVVNDGPGFLVNRILFPYLKAFLELLEEGVPFPFMDKTMETWGWPMGPAYLLDVIGLDTTFHGLNIMSEAFPERMQNSSKILNNLMENHQLGQKTSWGFYRYFMNKKGKQEKKLDEEILKFLPAPKVAKEEDLILRMMIPMVNEAFRCLEEGLVEDPYDIDMGSLYGLGFPSFRGGLMKWAQWNGMDQILKYAEKYSHLGPSYEPPQFLKNLANTHQNIYGE